MLTVDSSDKKHLIDPLGKPSPIFWLLIGGLLVIISLGVYAYIRQVIDGLAVTGMNRPVYWGLYMVNFIFCIGISLAGTFTSAILRITGVEWRRPITRLAEAVTLFALIIATLQIIIDMGRPDRLLYVMFYGRLQSPILWDLFIVMTYTISSAAYLYLPLIPDAAIIRDNLHPDAPKWQHMLYKVLALGWRGNVEQWRRLEKAVAMMAIFIIPVAISVHTITSWLLATTVQPGWHSTVFGPYFVVTAIFSGLSALFVVMTILRKTLHLEQYITMRQYRGMSWLFVTMAVTWGYFTYTETLTLVAGQQMMEFPVLASKMWGSHAITFWVMIGLIGVAFLIVLATLIVPHSFTRLASLQPRIMIGAGIIGGLLLLALTDPQFAPADGTTAEPFGLQTLGWAVFGLMALIVVLGAGAWIKQHTMVATALAGSFVLVGTWMERWNIVVPTLTHPRMIHYGAYTPTVTEIVISIASFALFVFMAVVFFKLFPAVSIWEVAEGRLVEAAEKRVSIDLPEPSFDTTKKHRWKFR